MDCLLYKTMYQASDRFKNQHPGYLLLTTMPICKFFQQGYCKKGSECDFEHISKLKGNYYLFILNISSFLF